MLKLDAHINLCFVARIFPFTFSINFSIYSQIIFLSLIFMHRRHSSNNIWGSVKTVNILLISFPRHCYSTLLRSRHCPQLPVLHHVLYNQSMCDFGNSDVAYYCKRTGQTVILCIFTPKVLLILGVQRNWKNNLTRLNICIKEHFKAQSKGADFMIS